MSEALKKIYNACDPYKPATDEYYCDCATARGESALVQRFLRHLNLSQVPLCFLFSGHIGCGKSSELGQLWEALENPVEGCARYFAILLDASDYLDDFDASTTDILLAIMTELAAELRNRLGIELKDSYFAKRLNEIKEFFLSDVEINEGELPLFGAKLKIQRLKKDPEARKKVRARLEPRLSTLLEEMNLAFDEARLKIKTHQVPEGERPYSDLVLIIDNLEKIRKIEGKSEGLDSQRELFLERYTQLTGMSAHVIYTVPLRLVRSANGPPLEQRYGPALVLPMIKIFERDPHQPFEAGLSGLRSLLQKRLGGIPLQDAFTDAALDFLLTYSGGHARNLLTFVQNACAYTDGIPIPLAAVQRAIQQAARTYSTAIPDHHWEKLARLDLSADNQIPNGDNDYLVMLENLSVLEYLDGGDDPFAVAGPWYAVNPIVRQLPKFKAAARTLQQVVT
ncbi:MAG: hypothetical protein ACJ74J_19340 [Blastocatellia bacterium]